MSMIKVCIADDHQLMLDGLSFIIKNMKGMQLVATAVSGQEVLDYVRDHPVDVLLLDINMPDLNGVEVCKRLFKRKADVKIIALSMYKRQSYIIRMLSFGARGYLLKDDSAEEIERAIQMVVAGEYYFSSQINVDVISLLTSKEGKENDELSEREIQILECIAHGLTNQHISEKLFLSQHTIETHRKNILRKLNAKNTADLVRIGIEKGLI